MSKQTATVIEVLSDRDALTDDELASLEKRATRYESEGTPFRLHIGESADLQVQRDAQRWHRRLTCEPAQNIDTSERREILSDVRELVYGWRNDIAKVQEQLVHSPVEEARGLFKWIVDSEDQLYSMNRVSPYKDVIPKFLKSTPAERMAQILEALAPARIARVLFDDYTRTEDNVVSAVLSHLPPTTAAEVMKCLASSVDRVTQAAYIIDCMEENVVEATLAEVPPSALLAFIDNAHTASLSRRLISRIPRDALDCVKQLLRDRNEDHRADNLERDIDPRDLSAPKYDPVILFAPARGNRTVRQVPCGQWIHIEEILESPFGGQPQVIDVLVIDPERYAFKCYAPEDNRLTYEQFDPIFKSFGDDRPTEEAFKKTGLFRLSEAVQKTGAIAGINGNFYFDHGHYTNGLLLGIDFSSVPALQFGDSIGWFMAKGTELATPVFNRAAFITNQDHDVFIERVHMTCIRFGSQSLRWDKFNETPSAEEYACYTPLFGFNTPSTPTHVDISIVGSRVVRVRDGGGSTIPFSGFVLQVPKQHTSTLDQLTEGTSVEVGNTFSDRGGSPATDAMACGPLLVQDGEVCVDFRVEDFGRKDSTVMSFFLPRLFDSYNAARSFIGLRHDGKVLMGAVSGTAFGTGRKTNANGMTFGELAVLAQDLGAVSAMGLDGGGSSTLIARAETGPQVLNVPTGGADVPRGAERFIANAVLCFSR